MSIPEPMTPNDCDLRGLPFMQLDVVRLIDSDLFALSTGEEFKAAVALWCKSWLQVPAASLPDDDRVLAHLSAAGSRWKKVKSLALRGWIKCADGRLYHPTVAEKALHAWKARTAQRERAAKRWQKKDEDTGNATASENDMPRHSDGTSHGNALERERERESKKKETLTSFVPPAEPSASEVEPAETVAETLPARPSPPDARTALFQLGLKAVRGLTGKSEAQSRSLIGKWLKACGDDASILNRVILDAADLRPAEPVAWIEAAVGQHSGRSPRDAERTRNKAAWLEGEMLEGF
ncbi:DUF1376 domain-containing protein [Gluconobacter albidus]|uniref:DUF1376 domain-containing protein n=1 Tax=Gluconobacter albidus TaxID=318683 RepID=A0ABQ5X0X2_9PROT|nr:DUF1376 domain-containing protein [Gluconobacter albidus]GBQ90067.1 hypothetical protein AA3250_1963 [Gluconobacter albidus NBRC 3250]GLQ69168.1 hypothetical protein GCM10007866_16190 [Gluconobacter albidus]